MERVKELHTRVVRTVQAEFDPILPHRHVSVGVKEIRHGVANQLDSGTNSGADDVIALHAVACMPGHNETVDRTIPSGEYYPQIMR